MGSSSELEHKIETLCLEASRKPNVFRYRLNVEKERLTDGIFKFLIQVSFTYELLFEYFNFKAPPLPSS